jgi:hypothetical protein
LVKITLERLWFMDIHVYSLYILYHFHKSTFNSRFTSMMRIWWDPQIALIQVSEIL